MLVLTYITTWNFYYEPVVKTKIKNFYYELIFMDVVG